MPKIEMTDRWCKTAKADQRTEFFDGLVRGLALVVAPTGRKTWYVHFTRADGKRGRLKIGGFPETSLAGARQKARAARADVGEGVDPVAAKRARAASMTVGDLAESFISRHASSKRTAGEIARRLRSSVVPVIGSVPLANLHRRDLTRVLDPIVDRGSPASANRTYDDLRTLMRWARSRGDLDVDPSEGMARPAPKRVRERWLSETEVRTLWTRLPSAAMSASTVRVIQLLLATGQRAGEVCGMRREELDLEAAVWRMSGDRTKNGQPHTVPLSLLALDIIKEQMEANAALARRKHRDVGGWIFPSPGGKAPLKAHAVSTCVRRSQAAIGIPQWSAHDLRRTAATHLEILGVSPFIVGHILNHLSTTRATVTTSTYARHDYAKEKREALDAWAERLAAIVEGDAAKIVPLRTAASA